jgi:hypothetical protein
MSVRPAAVTTSATCVLSAPSGARVEDGEMLVVARKQVQAGEPIALAEQVRWPTRLRWPGEGASAAPIGPAYAARSTPLAARPCVDASSRG